MLSISEPADLHVGQLFPKKNNTTTLFSCADKLTWDPANEFSVNCGALSTGTSGVVGALVISTLSFLQEKLIKTKIRNRYFNVE